jgi:simple sugar transport system permease protein
MRRLVKVLKSPLMTTVIAIILGLFVASVILLLIDYDPIQGLTVMFDAVFSRPKFIMNVIIKGATIILTGLSVFFAFKVGLFNIAAEGQYIISTITTTVLGIMLDLPPVLQIPIIITAGVLSGALFGGIIGYLKSKLGINEVITGIMFNWIVLYLCNYVSNSHMFHKPESDGTYPIREAGFTNLFYSWKFSEQGRAFLKDNQFLNDIILKTDFNVNFLIAILAVAVIWVLLNKTVKGYEFRIIGFNKKAADRNGINVGKNVVHAMLIAGALSGLAGALTVTGTGSHNIHMLPTFENNGFNGMSVALIAGGSPFGCIFSGLLFSALVYAGQSLQFKTGVPSEIVNIMIGIIVFFVALTKFIPMFIEKVIKRRNERVK